MKRVTNLFDKDRSYDDNEDKDFLLAFLSCCNQCVMNKKRNKTTGVVVKPIISKNFNKRPQMDLIDFQTLPDGEFRWLKNFQHKLETAKQLFEAVGYGNEEELCLNVDENEDVDTQEDVFNPRDFELEQLLTPPIQEEIVPIERPAEEKVEKANLLLGIRQNIDIDYAKSLYELAREAGVLNTLFARNSFDLVKNCSIELQVKLDKQISVSQAMNELSFGGGQGMVKCNCTGSCVTNRFSCKKSGLLCNSRCHGDNVVQRMSFAFNKIVNIGDFICNNCRISANRKYIKFTQQSIDSGVGQSISTFENEPKNNNDNNDTHIKNEPLMASNTNLEINSLVSTVEPMGDSSTT
ncbi:unnamed protein product [Brachionus calyciflorus]|uniref:Uncharacterized protein n=1 Tax=Brachionus calyciflorus TaxID=104777 RepID=A0A813M2C2_9BILA|nr:unnamed protein product [Brachionus calyciflorus]